MGLGERLNGIQEVSGSIPLISTKNRVTIVVTRFFSFLTVSEIPERYKTKRSRFQRTEWFRDDWDRFVFIQTDLLQVSSGMEKTRMLRWISRETRILCRRMQILCNRFTKVEFALNLR